MAKYSTEYKLKMVREYLAGQGGYRALSKRHEITESQIEHWVKAYRAFGEDGLKRSRAQQTYSFEFKRSAVECYLSTEASYQDVALAHGLNNPCYEELKTAIEEYIVYYNEHRSKESLGWLSPKEYRRRHCAV